MIQRIRIKNFKAIKDSKVVKLNTFTAFIGNNGSGKSSLIEALLLIHEAVVLGLANACGRWGGLERIRHVEARLKKSIIDPNGLSHYYKPVEIEIWGKLNNRKYHYRLCLNTAPNEDLYLVEKELLEVDKKLVFHSDLLFDNGEAITSMYNGDSVSSHYHIADGLFMAENTFLSPPDALVFRKYIEDWQFLMLNPQTMGFPQPQNRLTHSVKLAIDGRNIAEYVRKLSRQSNIFESLLAKMKFVLPYASDIQTRTSDDFDRKVELLMYENDQAESIPGWLFSTGTLRILAILSVLSNDDLPSVFLIDEIENGLDPRTIGLLVNEIRNQTQSKALQIITTTHSPYFLDLVPLESIIVTEKTKAITTFYAPKDDESLTIWKERFSPGKLYTMGKLTN